MLTLFLILGTLKVSMVCFSMPFPVWSTFAREEVVTSVVPASELGLEDKYSDLRFRVWRRAGEPSNIQKIQAPAIRDRYMNLVSVFSGRAYNMRARPVAGPGSVVIIRDEREFCSDQKRLNQALELILANNKISELDLSFTAPSENLMRVVSTEEELIMLDVSGCDLSQQAMNEMAKAEGLRTLHLASATFAPSSIRELTGHMSLECLSLNGVGLHDAHHEYFPKLPALQKLYIHSNAIGDQFALHILQSAPQLTVLDLCATQISLSGTAACINRQPSLQKLFLWDADLKGDIQFKLLSQTDLKIVGLKRDDAYEPLIKELTSLGIRMLTEREFSSQLMRQRILRSRESGQE